MSPLVALLALACAAPLAVLAQNCKGPITLRGQKTRYQIELPPKTISTYGGIRVKVEIRDECKLKGSYLVGVSVCVIPGAEVTIPSNYPFSPIIIELPFPNMLFDVTVLVTEYCDV